MKTEMTPLSGVPASATGRPRSMQITRSPSETEALAGQLAARTEPGCVIGLQGDLGAGKTAFVRGFARGLGFSGRIHSPTFALLNEYRGGRIPIHHLDLYRLTSAESVVAAGLEEYLIRPEGVTLVEWAERWIGESVPPAAWRSVWFRTVSETEREICHDWPT